MKGYRLTEIIIIYIIVAVPTSYIDLSSMSFVFPGNFYIANTLTHSIWDDILGFGKNYAMLFWWGTQIVLVYLSWLLRHKTAVLLKNFIDSI